MTDPSDWGTYVPSSNGLPHVYSEFNGMRGGLSMSTTKSCPSISAASMPQWVQILRGLGNPTGSTSELVAGGAGSVSAVSCGAGSVSAVSCGATHPAPRATTIPTTPTTRRTTE